MAAQRTPAPQAAAPTGRWRGSLSKAARGPLQSLEDCPNCWVCCRSEGARDHQCGATLQLQGVFSGEAGIGMEPPAGGGDPQTADSAQRCSSIHSAPPPTPSAAGEGGLPVAAEGHPPAPTGASMNLRRAVVGASSRGGSAPSTGPRCCTRNAARSTTGGGRGEDERSGSTSPKRRLGKTGHFSFRAVRWVRSAV